MIHTKLRNRLAMNKLHKLVFVHYNMRLRVRNLICKSDDDYYNPIDLNNIFNDDDILDEWIREGEQPMLPPDDLGWLDEGIRRSEKVAVMMVMAVMMAAMMMAAVMVAVMVSMVVMMKRLMVLVEANEVVL